MREKVGVSVCDTSLATREISERMHDMRGRKGAPTPGPRDTLSLSVFAIRDTCLCLSCLWNLRLRLGRREATANI